MKHHPIKSDSLGIFEFDIGDRVDLGALKKLVYAHKETYVKNVKTPVNCWHSELVIHRKIPGFDELVKVIESCVNEMAAKFNEKSAVQVKFSLLESLIGVYNRFDYTEAHTHHHLGHSACCYLSAENCAPIYFDDYKIETRTGMLLVFPGNLMHRVPVKLESHGERVIFACNLYPSYDASKIDAQFESKY